jgi:hypothetical protein
MPALYEIRWLSDGRTEKFAGSRGNYYELGDSEHLDLHSTPVWCHRCAKITDGEVLSTLEEIDQQIRDLHDPNSAVYRMTRHGVLDEVLGKGEEFLQKQLGEIGRRRRWRESRKSPPKCIHCGSIEIVELPIGKTMPNPNGDGEIRIDCVGMCSTSFNEWFFTPEGDRIPRDTRPTYWTHPELDKPEHRQRLKDWLRSLPTSGDRSASS